MAIPSEFEEKEFEAPLYNQIACGNRLVWSPGQVFEEHIGIDHALFLSDPTVWRFFSTGTPLAGAFLSRYDLEFIWRQRRRRKLPNFHLNLFIQAKRSHYHSRRPRHLRQYLDRGTCWRFDIDAAQQEALGKLAAKLTKRAVVCYAAPAFHRISQLYAHTAKGTVVPNSTFPLAENLKGHRSFYYTGPGGCGVANEDPEFVEGMGLQDLLERLVGNFSDASSEDTATRLKMLGEEIYQVVSEDLSHDNPRRPLFFETLRQSEQIIREIEGQPEAIRGFLRISTFAAVFNAEWYVVSGVP